MTTTNISTTSSGGTKERARKSAADQSVLVDLLLEGQPSDDAACDDSRLGSVLEIAHSDLSARALELDVGAEDRLPLAEIQRAVVTGVADRSPAGRGRRLRRRCRRSASGSGRGLSLRCRSRCLAAALLIDHLLVVGLDPIDLSQD